jgi:type I restriction enzyme R subunit
MVIEKLNMLYDKLTAKHVTAERLWNCYAIKNPEKVKKGVKAKIVDLISIIRYELGFSENLAPFADRVNYNFMQWTLKCNAGDVHFTEEQMKWLRLIKEHIITSLSVEPRDLDYSPFDGMGGLGRFFELFGEDYETVLHQMSIELVA